MGMLDAFLKERVNVNISVETLERIFAPYRWFYHLIFGLVQNRKFAITGFNFPSDDEQATICFSCAGRNFKAKFEGQTYVIEESLSLKEIENHQEAFSYCEDNQKSVELFLNNLAKDCQAKTQ